MNPTVAVIIAAYNAEATLERAIASALVQPEVAEVCIVDDGSTDGTLALAKAWAARDARVKPVTQRNAGPAAARNTAIAATEAPWIAILDADDYMLEGRLSALLSASAGADLVADALIRVSERGTPAGADAEFAPVCIDFETFILGNLSVVEGPLDLGFIKPIMRRDFLEANSLRYREDLRLGEDYDLYCRALLAGARFLIGGRAGYVSVDRPGSISNDHSEIDLERMRDCDDTYAAFRPLSERERRALRRHWTRVDCRLQWRRLISAVKRRDVPRAIATFHSPATVAFLAARLGEQVWLRGPVRLWLLATGAAEQAPQVGAVL